MYLIVPQMQRFRIYEEYAARCELLYADIDHTQKAMASGHEYDKGIETLHASLNPVNARSSQVKKALGLKDLLVKVSNYSATALVMIDY